MNLSSRSITLRVGALQCSVGANPRSPFFFISLKSVWGFCIPSFECSVCICRSKAESLELKIFTLWRNYGWEQWWKEVEQIIIDPLIEEQCDNQYCKEENCPKKNPFVLDGQMRFPSYITSLVDKVNISKNQACNYGHSYDYWLRLRGCLIVFVAIQRIKRNNPCCCHRNALIQHRFGVLLEYWFV